MATNHRFHAHRQNLSSPTDVGRSMSRAELAEAVNRKLSRLYPRRRALQVTERWIRDVELGYTSWPGAERRTALRIVLRAASDAELGLYDPRFGDAITDADPDRPGTVALGSAGRRASARLVAGRRHDAQASACIDWSRPRSDGVYDYWLGGKDYHAADRVMGEEVLAAFPMVAAAAAANRAFLRRAVRFLTEAGIRQFLDIGAGIPRPGCTHEIAQSIAADSRVVYVDHDPVVMSHGRALHTSDPAGRVDHVQADLREPETILRSAAVREAFDSRRPVGIVLGAVLHHIGVDEDAATAVKRLLAPMPSGSALVISHATTDLSNSRSAAVYEEMYADGRVMARARPAAMIRNFVHGLALVEPGLVPITAWRPDPDAAQQPLAEQVGMYGVVGRIR
ncbi:SAM-dependent methyltransferase [Actinoplanes sp. DH11]|uniref:SAM-dependent methyltransferase n=1 Tax=Actinoplanes sp. DH11 TaxID=2857011 RepID=UPI001E43F2B6|nr:SAM-dependent methyltransferase [Actinoplanes sp. DH11]